MSFGIYAFVDLRDLSCLSQTLQFFSLYRDSSIQLNISFNKLFVFQESLVYFPEQLSSYTKFNGVLFVATSTIIFIDTLTLYCHTC